MSSVQVREDTPIWSVGRMVKPSHFHCGDYGFDPRTDYYPILAQFGRAFRLGRKGRRFESYKSDHMGR